MDILLIGGLWLDGTAWDAVIPTLRELGHRPRALTLPATASTTLDDQLAAVLSAVDATTGPVLLVAHSAACTLGWLAVDARPERIATLVLVGGYPQEDGRPYAEFFDIRDGFMPFPGWAAFEGPDSADLDESLRERIAAHAVPVPEQVARGLVRFTDPRRHDVPVMMVCPEFTPAQVRSWVAEGRAPELAAAKHVEYHDFDSGHWPMLTKPTELARLLHAFA
ncbi:alpha/beta fold hydrolase [Kitasatospora cheerisanensis]|uniref:Esterase n=1 Tax=Kitasatospora cheerisanensis KCTC 2395 TaxID=1348663 RepID=A0A066YKY7_9ACTN|nr:alpha/beta hydrolase [Kitasatospora cheerisanensis]KDN81817.1 esterase [Kitasatospora cheerisanensis KCTC 2395]